jgi:hypothetical protein
MMPNDVPEWASFFTPERYALFIDRAGAVLRERGVPYELQPDRGRWVEGEPAREFGLVDLAQVANQAAAEEWDELIRHYVAGLTQGAAPVPEDLPTLRPLLKVRLYAPETIANVPTVKIPLADGLVIVLAVDRPESTHPLDSAHARRLGIASEELFDIGMANVRAEVQAERSDREFRNGGRIVSLASDDFFTTSLALALDEYAGPEPEQGFLVAVPNRHEILAVPLESGRSLGVLPALVSVARDLFRQGPGSLSPFVYWVRRRRWARLEIEDSDRGVGVAGPEGFVEEVLKPFLRDGGTAR